MSTSVGTWGLPATPPNTQSIFKPVDQAGRGCSLGAVGWQDLVARGKGGVGLGQLYLISIVTSQFFVTHHVHRFWINCKES